jgi:hypothetical protein
VALKLGIPQAAQVQVRLVKETTVALAYLKTLIDQQAAVAVRVVLVLLVLAQTVEMVVSLRHLQFQELLPITLAVAVAV